MRTLLYCLISDKLDTSVTDILHIRAFCLYVCLSPGHYTIVRVIFHGCPYANGYLQYCSMSFDST